MREKREKERKAELGRPPELFLTGGYMENAAVFAEEFCFAFCTVMGSFWPVQRRSFLHRLFGSYLLVLLAESRNSGQERIRIVVHAKSLVLEANHLPIAVPAFPVCPPRFSAKISAVSRPRRFFPRTRLRNDRHTSTGPGEHPRLQRRENLQGPAAR